MYMKKYILLIIIALSFLSIFSFGTNYAKAQADDKFTLGVSVKNPLGDKSVKFEDLQVRILDLVQKIALPIVVLMLIYTGFLFVMARGNDTKLTNARSMLTWTLVGAAIILGANLIANLLRNTVTEIASDSGVKSTTTGTSGTSSGSGSGGSSASSGGSTGATAGNSSNNYVFADCGDVSGVTMDDSVKGEYIVSVSGGAVVRCKPTVTAAVSNAFSSLGGYTVGQKVQVLGSVPSSDSNGVKWYVTSKGYIRSDLITFNIANTGGAASSTNTGATSSSTTTGSGASSTGTTGANTSTGGSGTNTQNPSITKFISIGNYNVRSSSNTASTVVRQLQLDEVLNLGPLENTDWYPIYDSTNKKIGYVNKSGVSQGETPVVVGVKQTLKVTDPDARLRSAASSSAASIGKLAQNSIATIYGELNGFYRVFDATNKWLGYTAKSNFTIATNTGTNTTGIPKNNLKNLTYYLGQGYSGGQIVNFKFDVSQDFYPWGGYIFLECKATGRDTFYKDLNFQSKNVVKKGVFESGQVDIKGSGSYQCSVYYNYTANSIDKSYTNSVNITVK